MREDFLRAPSQPMSQPMNHPWKICNTNSTARTPVTRVPLEQARNALSRLADAAHAGEVVTLTKHGRPWARLTPVESAEVARRRLAARWAVAGVDLDPYLLIPQRHKADLQQQMARQMAAHPWGCDPAGLGEELLGQPVLLDTHVLQWWWCCPGLLSPLVRSLLKQPAQPIWVSAISLMELSAMARTAANLPLQTALTLVQLDLEDEGLQLLNLQPQHLQRACRGPLAQLALHDALLLAQAEVEGMTLLSANPALQGQAISPLW